MRGMLEENEYLFETKKNNYHYQRKWRVVFLHAVFGQDIIITHGSQVNPHTNIRIFFLKIMVTLLGH